MVVIISFVARGLSCIRGDLFCYTAISSSAIVTILPGYLVRKSYRSAAELLCLHSPYAQSQVPSRWLQRTL